MFPNRKSPARLAGMDGVYDPFDGIDVSFIVRRAVLIRQMIERITANCRGGMIDVDGHVSIDPDVLDALLLTYCYKHGVRSIQAILEMSRLFDERSLVKTALPSRKQLAMHVDGLFYKVLLLKFDAMGSGILRAVLDVGSSIIPFIE